MTNPQNNQNQFDARDYYFRNPDLKHDEEQKAQILSLCQQIIATLKAGVNIPPSTN